MKTLTLFIIAFLSLNAQANILKCDYSTPDFKISVNKSLRCPNTGLKIRYRSNESGSMVSECLSNTDTQDEYGRHFDVKNGDFFSQACIHVKAGALLTKVKTNFLE